jgi:hypothetical protein
MITETETENIKPKRSSIAGGVISLAVFTFVLLTTESFLLAVVASTGVYQGYKQVKK